MSCFKFGLCLAYAIAPSPPPPTRCHFPRKAARMADDRATQILAALPEDKFTLKLKFLREKDDDWGLEDKFDPFWDERKNGQKVIEI